MKQAQHTESKDRCSAVYAPNRDQSGVRCKERTGHDGPHCAIWRGRTVHWEPD